MDRKLLLKQIKQKSLSGVYIFDGREEYLKEQALLEIRNSLLPVGFESLNETVIENADIDTIYDCAMALPFMCDKRLVIAKDPVFLSEKKSSKKDTELERTKQKLNELNKNNPSCVVIIYLRHDAEKSKSKAGTIIEEDKTVTFEQMSEFELSEWIKEYCGKYGLSIKADAVSELIQCCSGSMGPIKLELDKIIAYKGEGVIQATDVQSLVTPDTEASVFKMIDELLLGSLDKAYSILKSMLERNESSVAILSMITRSLRLMCYAKSMKESGFSQQEMLRSLELKYDFQLRNALKQSEAFSAKRITDLYKRAVETDASIKSGKIGERQGLDEIMLLINGNAKKPGT